MKPRITPALAFRWLTPFYDMANDLMGYGRTLMRRTAAVADLEGGERVLDVGCGTGSLLLELKSRHPDVEATGIDADPDVLRIAANKLSRAGLSVRLIQGYAQELPFPSGHFDLVASTLIFHHLPTPVKREAAREIQRVLKNGGAFILADFGKPGNLLAAAVVNIGSLFDGRENLKANLDGLLPQILEEAGFLVREGGPTYRGVQVLVARKPGL
ncbi:MAG: methyltransferase domain-containing protein [Chloroflexi bacterium]|nr:methyltransferase domain-containing protein [Chloroflexota bacterium]